MCSTNKTDAVIEEVKKMQSVQPSVAAQRATNPENESDSSDESGDEHQVDSVRT